MTKKTMAGLGRGCKSEEIACVPRVPHDRASAASCALHAINHVADAVFWVSAEGRIIDANAAASRLLGYSVIDELMTFHIWEIDVQLSKSSWPETWAAWERARLLPLNTALRSKSGQLTAVEGMVHFATLDGLLRACLVLNDTTARRLTEKALQATQEHLRVHIEETPVACIGCDTKGRVTSWNPSAERIFGFERYEIYGEVLSRLTVPASDREEFDAKHKRLLQGEVPICRCDRPNVTKSGRLIRCEWTCVVASRDGGEPQGIVSMAHDITERRQAEMKRDLLAAAVEQVAESIVITDVEGRIEYVNPAFERVSGYSAAEVIGHNTRLLKSGRHSKELYAELWHTISNGAIWNGHLINRRKDGSLYEEDASISPVRSSQGEIAHYVGVKRDVTDEYVLREQLRRSQKMEAIAHMTCGIAHDFNNLLTGILACAEFVATSLGDDAPELEDIKRIQSCGQRAASLTRQLLGFSRQQEVVPVNVDLAVTLSETQRLLRRVVSENIELIVVTAVAGLVRIDPARIQLALLNLVMNAQDAMPSGGILSFELKDSPDSEHVLLTVRDSGVGMDEETLEKIFQPFFTTKPEGRGTGLGLAAVREIIDEAGGSIRVTSELGRGTTFEIKLPRVSGAKLGGTAPNDPEGRAPRREVEKGNERIIVVDDHPVARRAIVQYLVRGGYEVEEAKDATEALSILRSRPRSFELLITDIVLPGLSGPDLARAAVDVSPQLRIVLISGYGASAPGEKASDITPMARLHKPVERPVLLRAVRKVLDSSASASGA